MVSEKEVKDVLKDFSQACNAVLDFLRQGKIGVQEFQDFFAVFDDFVFNLQDALEHHLKCKAWNERQGWQRFWIFLAQKNGAELCRQLRQYGFALRGSKVYKEIYDEKKGELKGRAYRLLELIRLGKRDEVFFLLFNIFQGTEISPKLARAFNPVYPDDLFRVFLYSFLSGLLGSEEKQPEEVEQ